MNINALNKADYLDILFDNRNKAYGGYQLRRTYGQRVGKAMLLLYGTLAALACYAMVPGKQTDALEEKKPFQTVCSFTEVKLPPPQVPAPPQQPAPPAKQTPSPNTATLTAPVIVNKDIRDDDYMTRQTDMTNAVAGSTTNSTSNEGIATITTTGDGNNIVVTVTDSKPQLPPAYVEVMPEFNGNIAAWLAANISYPQAARDAGMEGRVVLQFVVNEDGSISDAMVLRGIGGGCDDEALRVVQQMPKWKAGRQNGKTVKVLFRIPVVFTLQ
jgi:protein TonB